LNSEWLTLSCKDLSNTTGRHSHNTDVSLGRYSSLFTLRSSICQEGSKSKSVGLKYAYALESLGRNQATFQAD
jgi:hypothetical protein